MDIKEFIEKLYFSYKLPTNDVDKALYGFALGTEFVEWANLNDWYAIKDGGQVLWMNDKTKQVLPTTQLTELFLNYKMKEK